MRLSNKHANVQTVAYSDFSGGLNTTDAPETIGMNELRQSVNVEIYKGQLKTVAGTDEYFRDESKAFDVLMYDRINDTFLLTDADKKVYAVKRTEKPELVEIGTLTGNSDVAYASWDKGIVIASGGKLQYYDGAALTTLDGSPEKCMGVFIKQGRVWTYYGDELHTSAVGDATSWTTDTNDDSSAQWLQIGYKDGGIITGVCSLSSDVLIFKSNHYAYHLAGDFPNWQLAEIGRSIDCKDYNDCVALANASLCLGRTQVQAISTTDAYGDMQAQEISAKVVGNITALGATRVRYLPALNQVWFLSGEAVFLFLDLNTNGFFERAFTSPATDAVNVRNDVYVCKNHGIYVLNGQHMDDEGQPLRWKFQGKTLVSNNAFLIKRLRVDLTPYYLNYAPAHFRAGNVVLEGPLPLGQTYVYHDYTTVYGSKRKVFAKARRPMIHGEPVYGNDEPVFGSPIYVFPALMYRVETRCVDREQAIRVVASGCGGSAVFNSISMDIAEV